MPLRDFLYGLNLRFKACGPLYASEESRVLFAAMHLQGPAITWSQSTQPTWTWQQFQDALLRNFQSPNDVATARNELDRLRQTGSVAEYVREIREVTSRIPGIAPGDLLHRFTQGLRPDIRQWVVMKNPLTLEDAFQSAMNIDNSMAAVPLERSLMPPPPPQRSGASAGHGSAHGARRTAHAVASQAGARQRRWARAQPFEVWQQLEAAATIGSGSAVEGAEVLPVRGAGPYRAILQCRCLRACKALGSCDGSRDWAPLLGTLESWRTLFIIIISRGHQLPSASAGD